MGTLGKSKPFAQSADDPVSRKVTEYTLKNGKQGVFTNANLDMVKQFQNNMKIADAQSGVENVYTIVQRDVEYDGEGTIPKGNDALGLIGKVTETEVSQ